MSVKKTDRTSFVTRTLVPRFSSCPRPRTRSVRPKTTISVRESDTTWPCESCKKSRQSSVSDSKVGEDAGFPVSRRRSDVVAPNGRPGCVLRSLSNPTLHNPFSSRFFSNLEISIDSPRRRVEFPAVYTLSPVTCVIDNTLAFQYFPAR